MITINGKPLDKDFIFPGGEVQIRLPKLDIRTDDKYILVNAKLDSSDEIMKLLLVSDALNFYYPQSPKILKCHYLPYARQDRRCMPYEAYSVDVIIQLLDKMTCFNKIEIVDPHCGAYLFPPSKFDIITKFEIFKNNSWIFDLNTSYNNEEVVFVAPDKGAEKEVRDLANYFGKKIIVANKVRDPDTGRISSIEIVEGKENIKGNYLLVIDDICDGGGTFVLLAEQLKEANFLELYVSHGIFSQGLDKLSEHYGSILTTNSLNNASDYRSHGYGIGIIIL